MSTGPMAATLAGTAVVARTSVRRWWPPRPGCWLLAGLAALTTTTGFGAYAAHRIVMAHETVVSLQVRGTLRLVDPDTERNQCRGTNGFDDISSATHVLLFEDGHIVGVTTLGRARADSGAGTCTWVWAMSTAPTGTGTYSVQVGDRGLITFTREQLAHGRATLTLTRPTVPG